ncbi:MAG: FecR family protein [Cyclobacteriaceae bacterium]
MRSRQLEAAFQAKRNAQRGKIRQLIWYRAAVVSGLVLTAALVWFLLKADSLTEYATDYGEIRTLTLPDSSRVTLNANSAIHYAAKWDVDVAREVWLDGEAYFSVTHTQNDQPFIVHVTDGLRVNVLGTEFNVK